MALTDTTVRNAKPKEKPYKLGDAGGLFLLVQPTGGKLWRLKYRIDGREKKLGLGAYPETSLAQARAGRDDARKLLAAGIDPGLDKARRKAQAKIAAENSFEAVAREYITKRTTEGLSPTTIAKAEFLFAHFKPSIGKMAIADIIPTDVLAVMKRAEADGKLETARRLHQFASAVCRYAVATARLATDPTRDLRGALTSPRAVHYGAIIEPVRVGELLRAIDGYKGHYVTLYALKLAPYVFVRPGELRFSEWNEIDFDAAVWAIPAARMKMRKPHHVPLSRQALDIFRAIRDRSGVEEGYIFPSIRTRRRPMSENTLNAGLRRLGYTGAEMTAHGFRAMASTLLNESGKWHPDAIERALAHQDSDSVRAAYHRGAHWKERVEMAQWWADHLDQLRRGADIVQLHGGRDAAA